MCQEHPLLYYFLLVYIFVFSFFFFSSRRRHTRLVSDWSSDVCSSDLNVLDRRVGAQSEIPSVGFSQYLRSSVQQDDVRDQIVKGFGVFRNGISRYKPNPRYTEWIAHAEKNLTDPTVESLRELFTTRILLARDELKRQMSLELAPLSREELDERDSSQVQAAAELFLHEELRIPHYYGIERLCILATNNVEEL